MKTLAEVREHVKQKYGHSAITTFKNQSCRFPAGHPCAGQLRYWCGDIDPHIPDPSTVILPPPTVPETLRPAPEGRNEHPTWMAQHTKTGFSMEELKRFVYWELYPDGNDWGCVAFIKDAEIVGSWCYQGFHCPGECTKRAKVLRKDGIYVLGDIEDVDPIDFEELFYGHATKPIDDEDDEVVIADERGLDFYDTQWMESKAEYATTILGTDLDTIDVEFDGLHLEIGDKVRLSCRALALPEELWSRWVTEASENTRINVGEYEVVCREKTEYTLSNVDNQGVYACDLVAADNLDLLVRPVRRNHKNIDPRPSIYDGDLSGYVV